MDELYEFTPEFPQAPIWPVVVGLLFAPLLYSLWEAAHGKIRFRYLIARNSVIFLLSGGAYMLAGFHLMYPLTDSDPNYGELDLNLIAIWDTVAQTNLAFLVIGTLSASLGSRVPVWLGTIFGIVIAGLAYPMVGQLHWGGGVLSDIGFKDFSGGMLCYGFGAVIALCFSAILGSNQIYRPELLRKGWMVAFGGIVFLIFLNEPIQGFMSGLGLQSYICALFGIPGAIFGSLVCFRKIRWLSMLHGLIAGSIALSSATDVLIFLPAAIIALAAGFAFELTRWFFKKSGIDDPADFIATALMPAMLGCIVPAFFVDEISLRSQLIGMQVIMLGGTITGCVLSLLARTILSSIHPQARSREDPEEQAER